MARARDLDTQDKAACSAFLAEVLKEHPQYTGILTITPNGELHCDSLRTGRVLNLTDRDYFQKARLSAASVVVEPVFGRLTGIAVLQVAYAARRDTGEMQFVLLASVNLKKYMQHLATSASIPGTVFVLLDRKGAVLARHPEREALAGTSIADSPLFRLVPGGVGEARDVDGELRVWAVSALPSIPDAGLYILAGVSKRDLAAGANRRLAFALSLLAGASLLVLSGAWFLAELGIRRQVGRIVDVVERLSAGDLGARVGLPHPRGELGQLMASLNHTAASLEGQRKTIEGLNQRLTALIDSSPAAIVCFDTAGQVTVWNPAAERLFGWAAAEVVGRMHPAVPDDQKEDFARSLAHAMSGKAIADGEGVRRTKDGRRIDVTFRSAPLYDDDGRQAGAIFAVTDVTALRENEAALRQANEGLEARVAERTAKLHGLIEATRQISLALGRTGGDDGGAAFPAPFISRSTNVSGIDAVALEVTRAAVALTGASLATFWLADDEARVIRLRAVSDEQLEREFPVRTLAYGEGAAGWVAANRANLVIPDIRADRRVARPDWWPAHGVRSFLGLPIVWEGTLLAVLGLSGREPFAFSQEERDTAEAFTSQVAIALRNTILYEAGRAAGEIAHEANQAKNEFLSRMSHELRTPLNAVLGFAQLLGTERLTPDQEEAAEEIVKAGRHLLSLINEVLDISSIESGQQRVSSEPVLVGDLVRSVLDLVRPLAAKRSVQIEADAESADGRYVLADRQRIQQVLLNLVSNGIKYNRQGGRVTIACEPGGGQRMRITVADTGPGIAEHLLPRLFTPFDRLGAEQTDVPGTGLGLALSRRLVEAMNGAIGVESAPGRGSTFWVELPLMSELAPAAAVAPAASETPAAHTAATTGTVLYIEDNLANVRLIEYLLHLRPGVTLLSAMQGGIGIELAQQHRPELILLDLHLPDMQGDEVLRQLKANPRTRAIPVVVMSADASPGQVQRLIAAGTHVYITKPINVHEVLRLIDDTVGGH